MAIVTIIIIFSIGFSGCVEEEKDENKDEITYSYLISIIPEQNKNYFIFLPVPINDNGSVSKIFHLLNIKKGNGNFNLIQTKYGFAINISSSEEIILHLEGTDRLDIDNNQGEPNIYLSLENDFDRDGDNTEWDDGYNEYWIFLNRFNNLFNVSLLLEFNVSDGKTGLVGRITISKIISIDNWIKIGADMDAWMD